MTGFQKKKKIAKLCELGITDEVATRLVNELEKTPQDTMEKRIAKMIASGKDSRSDDLAVVYFILRYYERASRNGASSSQPDQKRKFSDFTTIDLSEGKGNSVRGTLQCPACHPAVFTAALAKS